MVGVILAAGLGTRMKSDMVKVLHPVCGRPMLAYVVDALQEAGAERVITVIGHQSEKVKAAFGNKVEYALQERQLGTGHAVMQTKSLLSEYSGIVIVANGDAPLLQSSTLAQLMSHHTENNLAATVLTAVLDDPTGYGRVVRNEVGEVLRIVEHKDTIDEERAVKEINTGMYAFSGTHLFSALARVGTGNAQGEFYLTDVIDILRKDGLRVGAVAANDPRETLGVNDRVQLAEADKLMRERTLRALMLSGVTIIDPQTTYIEPQVKIGKDTVLYPYTYLAGDTQIGEKCILGPHCQIKDTQVGDEAKVSAAELSNCVIGARAEVGAYVCLEPGTVVQPGCTIRVAARGMGDEKPNGH